MTHEYVFRGEREPFAPDPKDQRERELAKREAEQLVSQKPAPAREELLADADVQRGVADYQVGGLDSFGVAAAPPSSEDSDQTVDRDLAAHPDASRIVPPDPR